MTTATAANAKSTRNLTAIFGVAIVVFISKILGLGREVVVADRFGTSAEYDLYLIAVMLPALAYGVINFASFYLLVPYLTRSLEKQQEEVAEWRSIWNLFNISLVCAAGVTALLILSAPYLMRIWAGDNLVDDFVRIVFYSRVTAAMVILGTSEAFLRALLNVRRIYTWPAGGYIVENLFFILAVLLLSQAFSVGAIVLGLLGGMVAQNIYLLLRLAPMGALRRYRLSMGADHLPVWLPTLVFLIVIELLNRSYFLFDRYVATEFGAGIISALNYSQVLVQLPDAIVGFAIASVVFPVFSETATGESGKRIHDTYRNAIVGGMLLTIPLAVFFLLNAVDLVRVIFLRGAFDATSLEVTAGLLRPYTPTIIALFVISTSLRVAYGRGWVKAVLAFTLVALVIKAAATFTFPRAYGYQWITFATSLAYVTFASSLFTLCLIRLMGAEARRLILEVVKLGIAGAIALAAGFWLAGFVNYGIQGISLAAAVARMSFSGAITLAAFVAATFALGFGRYYRLLLRRQYGS